MRHFKEPETGKVYAFDTDGHQDHLIGAALGRGWPEVPAPAPPAPAHPLFIKMLELEATVTPRRLREAILGIDNEWLKDLEERISELRSQL